MPGAKSWWMLPGECYDKRGIPIYPGDLIRSPHFQTKRKKYYLYHVAVFNGEYMEMVPTSHLHEPLQQGGGRCLLSQNLVDDAEVIHGHGPGEILDAWDRPRKKLESSSSN